MPQLLPLFKGLGVQIFTLIFSYIASNALQIVFDIIDEAAESALEKAEVKAAVTPEKADDRRIAVLRKYFEGWKVLKK